MHTSAFLKTCAWGKGLDLARPESQSPGKSGPARATRESMVFNSPFARRVPLFPPNIGVPLGLFSRNTSQKRSYRHERFCGKKWLLSSGYHCLLLNVKKTQWNLAPICLCILFTRSMVFSSNFFTSGPQIRPPETPDTPRVRDGYGTTPKGPKIIGF